MEGGQQLLWCHNIIVSLPKLLAKSHSTDEQSRAVIKLYHYDVHMMQQFFNPLVDVKSPSGFEKERRKRSSSLRTQFYQNAAFVLVLSDRSTDTELRQNSISLTFPNFRYLCMKLFSANTGDLLGVLGIFVQLTISVGSW